jgi:hypothetical protein
LVPAHVGTRGTVKWVSYREVGVPWFAGGSPSSLTKQRRHVLTNGGDLEKLANQGEPQTIELILGSKAGQKTPISKEKSVCYENHTEP